MMGRGLLLVLSVVGCGSEKVPLVDTTDTDPRADDTAAGGASPYASGIGQVACAPNPDGIDTWSVSVNVGDPQDDVATLGSTVSVVDDAQATLATYDLACTASNTCSGSWTTTRDGIDCNVGRASVFRFLIVDDAGNVSAPYDYQPL